MIKRIAIILLLALRSVAAVPAEGAAGTPPKLSADQILEKHGAARGGLEAWRKIRTMGWIGHLQSATSAEIAAKALGEHQAPRPRSGPPVRRARISRSLARNRRFWIFAPGSTLRMRSSSRRRPRWCS